MAQRPTKDDDYTTETTDRRNYGGIEIPSHEALMPHDTWLDLAANGIMLEVWPVDDGPAGLSFCVRFRFGDTGTLVYEKWCISLHQIHHAINTVRNMSGMRILNFAPSDKGANDCPLGFSLPGGSDV